MLGTGVHAVGYRYVKIVVGANVHEISPSRRPLAQGLQDIRARQQQNVPPNWQVAANCRLVLEQDTAVNTGGG